MNTAMEQRPVRLCDTGETRTAALLQQLLEWPGPGFGENARWLRMRKAVSMTRDLLHYMHWLPQEEREEILKAISNDRLLTEDFILMAEALMDLTTGVPEKTG